MPERHSESPYRERQKRLSEYVVLRNIPRFHTLPSSRILKRDYKLDSIWEEGYHKDRPIADFGFTKEDCVQLGLKDELSQYLLKEELARAIAASEGAKESLTQAKVFDISDELRRKKDADPSHSNRLSTKEVLEAIDEAGYRPATLEELLAYGRDHWEPDADPKTFTEEKLLQRVNVPYIHAIGSPFVVSGGRRCAPYLSWGGDERSLTVIGLVGDWSSDSRFLVLHK